ncbi:hypothetical protein [uncultured Mediterranean phage uvMED]|nr:hypothetical protein [uncultured Mediterranean phage uvMED]
MHTSKRRGTGRIFQRPVVIPGPWKNRARNDATASSKGNRATPECSECVDPTNESNPITFGDWIIEYSYPEVLTLDELEKISADAVKHYVAAGINLERRAVTYCERRKNFIVRIYARDCDLNTLTVVTRYSTPGKVKNLSDVSTAKDFEMRSFVVERLAYALDLAETHQNLEAALDAFIEIARTATRYYAAHVDIQEWR